MKTRIEVWQNGKVILHDLQDLAEHYELSMNKVKCLIQEILGIYGYVEFKKIEE